MVTGWSRSAAKIESETVRTIMPVIKTKVKRFYRKNPVEHKLLLQ